MTGLVQIAPVYYVTGNHEWASGMIEELFDVLDVCGVTVLRLSLIHIFKDAHPDTLPQSILTHCGLSRPGTALGRPARNTDAEATKRKPPTLKLWKCWRA